eukprot:jgi/Orpsp1_1/1190625/evm.model.d7180000080198.1
MARIGSSMGNARTQRINQAKFGDITVRYGKDKRSNVNRKVPSSLKVKNYESKSERRHSFGSSSRRVRVSREYLNHNRITLSKFVRWSLFLSISLFCIWAYINGDSPVVQRQKRSISEVISEITNKYIATGYTGGQSAAAWTRQRRSKGAHSDDMSNPHNGATTDGESIVQKMLSDFAKLVKTESEGYTS